MGATIIGNIANELELKHTKTGTANLRFGVIVERRYKKNNEWESHSSLLNVQCWGRLAENVHETFSKGDRAIVTGRLDQHRWTGKDGKDVNTITIVADDVGPSLFFDTADIRRNPKNDSDNFSQEPF